MVKKVVREGISFKDAKAYCSRTMGRPIRQMGFEERTLGSTVVNTLYFTCNYEIDLGYTKKITEYRMQVFINGQASVGVILR